MDNQSHFSEVGSPKFSTVAASGYGANMLNTSSRSARTLGGEDRQTLLGALEVDLKNIRDRLAKHAEGLGDQGVRLMGHVPLPGAQATGGVAPEPVTQMDRLGSVVSSLRYFMDEAESAAARLNNIG